MMGLTWFCVWVDSSYDGVNLALCRWILAVVELTWLGGWVDSSYDGANLTLWVGGL